MIASSNAQWQNGDILPEIKELFPDTPIIGRTGIINAYEDRPSALPLRRLSPRPTVPRLSSPA
jgi:hypothetical protein